MIPGLLPAIDLYDGPSFRVLRKFIREHPSEGSCTDFYILSGKYGLIPGNREVGQYDEQMTEGKAREMNAGILRDFEETIQNGVYKELFLNLGKNYLLALEGFEEKLPLDISLKMASGSIGARLAMLKSWLHNGVILAGQNYSSTACNERILIRGRELQVTKEKAFDIARSALRNRQGNPYSYKFWYVELDGSKVAPKWFVSQIAGLPVGSFHTNDAIRILKQLNIGVLHR